MDVFYGVGPGDQQIFVTAFESQTAKVLQRQVLHLKIGTHGAVKDDDAFFQCFEKTSHVQFWSAMTCHRFSTPIFKAATGRRTP